MIECQGSSVGVCASPRLWLRPSSWGGSFTCMGSSASGVEVDSFSQPLGVFSGLCEMRNVPLKVVCILHHWWWKYKVLWPYWRAVWQYTSNCKMYRYLASSSTSMNVVNGNTYIKECKYECTRKIIASSLSIGNNWKWPKCISVWEWQTSTLWGLVQMLRTMKKSFVCKGIESKEEPRLAVTSESMFNFWGHYSHRIQCRWCSQDLFDRVEVCFHFLFYVYVT